MKKPVHLYPLAVCLVIMIISSCSEEKTCIIKGKTVGVENKSVFLFKAGDDIRYGGLEIPVVDNAFEYKISYTYPERYQLALNRLSIPDGVPTFFTEPGEIFLTVYPDNMLEKNTVEGGKINAEYHSLFNNLLMRKPVFDSLEIIFRTQSNINDTIKMLENNIQTAHNSQEKESIETKIQRLKDSMKDLSQKENTLSKKTESIYQEYYNLKLDYIKNNTSIISYYLLYEVLSRHKNEIDLKFVEDRFEKLSEKYPGHPYTGLIGNLLGSIKNIHVGGRYIDFSAPDPDGKIIKVSEIIDGKIALIDLWSTWCSSCILTSRSMISVYNEFKDRGFTIIGVAANKDRDEISRMIEKEKYPWITLTEVNNQNKIWEKYGISNWGGATFLIGKDGEIISISPTADEVREILREAEK